MERQARGDRGLWGRLLAIGALAALLACGCLLAGCAGSPDAGETKAQAQQEGTQAEEAAPREGEDVRILVKVPTLEMSSIADPSVTTAGQFLRKAADAFEASPQGKGVTIDVVEFEIAEETANISDCFDTPNSPDVLYEGYFNMFTYVHTGRVVPLDDIITDAMRADIDQEWWDQSSAGGKVYMMPFLGLQNTLGFNRELFEQCGLEEFAGEPGEMQTWTLEEWDTVLSTLKDRLPDNAYPMMMYGANDQGDTHIMTLLRSRGADFYDSDGRFNINTPEGIAALQWIKDSYDKGWFPAGADTLELIDNYNLFVQSNLGIYVNNAALDVANSESGGFEIGSVNFPSADGAGFHTTFVTGFEVFDNGDAVKTEAAKAFVKFIYESEFIDYMAGQLPASNTVAEKYAAQTSSLEQYVTNTAHNFNFTNNHPNWRGVRDVFYQNIQDLLFGSMTPEETAAAIDETCNAAIDEGYATSVLHE